VRRRPWTRHQRRQHRQFGEPVYETTWLSARDGYLAACEIQTGRVNLDDTGITIDDILAVAGDANTDQPVTREQSGLYEKTRI
jgi:type I restriction enzyme R subunit